MKLNVIDNFGLHSIIDVMFSFELNGKKYLATRMKKDENMPLCLSFSWCLWSGIKTKTVIDDEVLAFALTIMGKSKENPDFYKLKGEHYVAKDNEFKKIARVKRHPLLKYNLDFINVLIKWFVLMLVSSLCTRIYIEINGLSWGYSLFPNISRDWLVTILYGIQLIISNLFFLIKKNKWDLFSILLNPMISTSIITVIGAAKSSSTLRTFILVFLGVSVLLLVLPKFVKAVKTKKKSAKKHNLKKAVSELYYIAVVCVVLGTFCVSLFNISAQIYTGEAETPKKDEQKISDDYYYAVQKIERAKWKELSSQEKIEVLQDISDYECMGLGCDSVPIQAVIYEEENHLGSYNSFLKCIYINNSHLKNGDVEEVVDTILHEVRHVWQRTVVNMYEEVEKELDEDYLRLELFQMAQNFQYNFDTYNSSTDFEKYYYQDVEMDSREWAKMKINSWYNYCIEGKVNFD